jgi:putative N-acetylmannosamine-6-phosphate epimerase
MLAKYVNDCITCDSSYVRGLSRLLVSRDNTFYTPSHIETIKPMESVRNNGLFPIVGNCFLNISTHFISHTAKRISDIFQCSSERVVGIDAKTRKYYVSRGIVTDMDLTPYLAVMAKDNISINTLYNYIKSDIVVLVKRESYMSSTPKTDPMFKFIRTVVNDCIDNGLEVRILDEVHCFTVPDTGASEINQPVNKEIIKNINLTL